MECINCGRVLTPLTEILAQSEVGTHCPHCWTRIRRAAPRQIAVPRKTVRRPAASKLKRAA